MEAMTFGRLKKCKNKDTEKRLEEENRLSELEKNLEDFDFCKMNNDFEMIDIAESEENLSDHPSDEDVVQDINRDILDDCEDAMDVDEEDFVTF